MKKQANLSKSILMVAIITALLLMVPLVAMQFTSDVNWSASDFIIMGALLFCTGLSYVFIIRFSGNIVYRIGIGSAIGTTFLMVWANLAVGLIGSGPHYGNLMYIGVIAIVIAGVFVSNFKAAGLERTMFAAAISLLVIAAIALLAGMQNYPQSSVIEIIGVNAFFATLFAVSGLLFRHVALNQVSNNSTTSA